MPIVNRLEIILDLLRVDEGGEVFHVYTHNFDRNTHTHNHTPSQNHTYVQIVHNQGKGRNSINLDEHF